MRPALALLVAVLLIAAAAATADGCFNLLLYARPDAIDVAVPINCANAWRSNQRTVHAAHVDDAAARASLLSTYASARHTLVYERFDTTSGALIDSVALAAPPAAPIVAACATAYDVWAAADGALWHWDAVTGARRAVAQHDAVVASDRVWLACGADRAWASVPAARAVWELDPVDARVTRVVARLASPNVLAADATRLWIIDGRPGVTAWAVDISNATGAGMQRAVGAGLRATPLETPVVDAAVRSDGALLTMDGAGGFRVVAAAGAPQPASLGLAYSTAVHALASATLGVRGAGALVDVHSGRARVPPASALANNGNLAPLAYRPVPVPPFAVRVVGTDGGVALLDVPPLNASGPCAELVHDEWEPALTAAAASVAVLDVALDGSIVWRDTTTSLLRVRLAGADADVLLPAAPAHVQVRVIGGAQPGVCILADGALECRDLAGGIVPEPTPMVVPAADAAVLQWDGADALVLFGVVGADINMWRTERPFGGPLALRCSLDMSHLHEARQPEYWGVAPVGGGGFLVRWTADVALVIDGACALRAVVDSLRPDAQPTLAYAASVIGDEVCIDVNGTRPVRLPRRVATAWIALGSVLFVLCATMMAAAFVCIVAPRAVWRRYTSGNGTPWMRFGVKRRRVRGCLSLDHDAQASIYTLVSCVCPCIADWLHARMQRWRTPIAFEGTAPDMPGTSATAAAASVLLSEHDDPRWAEIDADLLRHGSPPASAAAAAEPDFGRLAARMAAASE